jgi:hypothetical protein
MMPGLSEMNIFDFELERSPSQDRANQEEHGLSEETGGRCRVPN